MGSVTAPWLAQVGIITVRDLANTGDRHPPYPSELLATFVIFGALGLLSGPAPKAATYMGWGIVLATLISSKVDVLGPLGRFLGGNPAPANPQKGP